MILHAEGGTDGAMMGLYWPAYLPQDLDRNLADDPYDIVEELEKQERLISLPCDSDGGYHLSVYIDEEPPADRLTYYKKENSYPEVKVEGPTFYGGLEYIFEHNIEAEGENYIGLCEILEVPEGAYGLDVYILQMTDQQKDACLIQRLGPNGQRIFRIDRLCVGLGSWAVFIFFLSLICLIWAWWPLWTMAVSCLVFLLNIGVGKLPGLNRIFRLRQEIETEFPHYLVTMRKKAD